MADNVNVTPGSGVTVRAEEVDSILYQIVGLALVAGNGVVSEIEPGQQTKDASVPVVIASDQDALDVQFSQLSLTVVCGTASDAGSNELVAAPGASTRIVVVPSQMSVVVAWAGRTLPPSLQNGLRLKVPMLITSTVQPMTKTL